LRPVRVFPIDPSLARVDPYPHRPTYPVRELDALADVEAVTHMWQPAAVDLQLLHGHLDFRRIAMVDIQPEATFAPGRQDQVIALAGTVERGPAVIRMPLSDERRGQFLGRPILTEEADHGIAGDGSQDLSLGSDHGTPLVVEEGSDHEHSEQGSSA
jgi:hypothetical protein